MVVNAPNIIFTIKYTQGGVDNIQEYLDYTERDEAVDQTNDFNLEKNQTNNQTPENLNGYLGYTERDAATSIENNAHRYPTFNKDFINLSEEAHERLKEQLLEAQQNHSLMWEGVVSFDPKFLKENQILSDDGAQVDQAEIKKVIQKAMPRFLKNEGLDVPETFWWGDIHLNTEHVHVHLTISQTKNTRSMDAHGKLIGIINQESIRDFKRDVNNGIVKGPERERQIKNERRLATLKQDLKTGVMESLTDLSNEEMLTKIWEALPDYSNQSRWRSSNHSKDFRQAKRLTDQYVERLLTTDLQDAYADFKNQVDLRNRLAQKRYGQHIKDTTRKKDQELKNYLANRVYDYMRTISKGTDQAKLLMEEQGKSLAENNAILDQKQVELTQLMPNTIGYAQLKQEIGLRKKYIRVENAKLDNYWIDQKVKQLKQVDSPYRDYFIAELNNQRQLNDLIIKPKNQYKNGDNAKYRYLKAKYTNPRHIAINQVSQQTYELQMERLSKISGIMAQSPNDPAVQIMLPNQTKLGAANALKYYQTEQNILKTKLEINQNNHQFKDNKTLKTKKNRPLFQQLYEYNQLIENSELIDQHLINEAQFNQTQDQQNGGPVQMKGHLAMTTLKKAGRQLDRAIAKEARDRIRAMNRAFGEEMDAMERMDYEAEREQGRSI